MFGRIGRRLRQRIKLIPQCDFNGTPISRQISSLPLSLTSHLGRNVIETSKISNFHKVHTEFGRSRGLSSSKSEAVEVEAEEEKSPSNSLSQGKDPVIEAAEAKGETGDVEFTLQLTDEQIQEITNGDPELIKKVKYIQLEHEVYRQEGLKVPSYIKLSRWKELLTIFSPSGRRKFYAFLWQIEMKQEGEKVKKKRKIEQRLQDLIETSGPLVPREEDPYGIGYGLGRNSMFIRLYDTTINKFYHHRMISAMTLGRPLVLDLGYDEFMTNREANNCAKQIEIMLTQNKTHQDPFDLHLCNAHPNSKVVHHLSKIIPTIFDDSYALHITEKSYLDIFPRKELVYLSPHAREELEEFQEDEIYIIGAMVDKSDPRPLSLAKSKRENLPMKKLPIDKYLVWGLGNKSLTINQMAGIMLDLRLTGDWRKALDHVPKRKLNRQFHPYPDQIVQREENSFSRTETDAPVQQAFRRESKSRVLGDHELLNKRKGFRRFESGGFERSPNYSPRSSRSGEGDWKGSMRYQPRPPQSEDGGQSKNRIRNIRSLFEE